eukprot:8218_1
MASLPLLDSLIQCFTMHQPDFNIFQQETFECNLLNRGCTAVKRIIHGLKHFSCLDQDATTYHQTLVQFVKNTYVSLLDDYIHIIQCHNDNLDYISTSMINDYHIIACDINKCSFVLRHFRSNKQDDMSNLLSDDDFVFYRNLIDSIHCYLFHSYDIGLRVNTDENQFVNIREAVSTKKQHLQTLNGFNQNRFAVNKFNLNVNIQCRQQQSNEESYMDGLYAYIDEYGNQKHKLKLKLFQQFILSEEYDTDALLHDGYDQSQTNSNIALNLQNDQNTAEVPINISP